MGGKDLPSDTTTISTLSVEQADRLARREGDLDLDGLTTLSLEVATALAKHEGALTLSGLTLLSAEAAEALAKQRGELGLGGLTKLSPEVAGALAKHKGTLLGLSGLRTLSPEVAEALGRHEATLFLRGLNDLSCEVADRLAKHEGALVLDGLTTLSLEVAQALAKHEGYLSLDGLTTLSPEVAEALAKHEGQLDLNGLSAEVGAALRTRPTSHGDAEAGRVFGSFNEWWDAVGQQEVSSVEQAWLKDNEPNDPDDSGGGDYWHVNQVMHEGEAHNTTHEIAERVFNMGLDGEEWEPNMSDGLFCDLDSVVDHAYSAGLEVFRKLGRIAPSGPFADPFGAVTNSIGMKLVPLPVGEFLMGSPEDCPLGDSEEEFQHRVRITRPFLMSMHQVTQAEYERITGENPSRFKGSDLPVEHLRWQDAMRFCEKLSLWPAEQAAGRRYRLPTEAEWEYACRAGTTTPFNTGDELRVDQARFATNRRISPNRLWKKSPSQPERGR